MLITYNSEKLKQITNDLFVLTGISIAFLDSDYNYICRRTKTTDFCTEIQLSDDYVKKCAHSDKCLLEKSSKSKKYESHICHAGLYDAVMPIIKNNSIAGYVLMGRVRCSTSPAKCRCNGSEKLNRLFSELPYFSEQQIVSIQALLSNILFSEAITFESDVTAVEITNYINENLNSNITVNSICDKFFISKNRLYKVFHKYYNTTVNDYITNLRMEKARKLLTETNEPVYSVCEQTGIGNYTYFCKLFKKLFNVTPTEFRKHNV